MIIVFLLIISIVLLGGHSGLFFSWTWLFGIKSLLIKKILGITLGIFAVSFVVGSALAHFAENWLTGKIYIASSIWLGLAWYFVLATVLALLLSWLSLTLGANINTKILTSILLG